MNHASPGLHIETRSVLGPADIERVWSLLRSAADADGHPPIGEHRWVDLVQGGREMHAAIIATLSGHPHGPVGYAQVSGAQGDWALDLVVHPHHRKDPDGVSEALLAEALDEVRRAGGGHVHLWVPKPTARDDEIAARVGLHQGRDLLQLRRPLPLEDELTAEARAIELRSFRPGRDEDAWLAVNNRAFAWHPEQGGWTPEILTVRMREPWFDPAGFLLHEAEGQIAGFCWTKVHDEEDPSLGEIYVIAVDPDHQNHGLGRRLTLAGLDHLAGRGLRLGMLYVDAANQGAVSLYRSLGFSLDHLDRAYVGDVSAGH